MAGLIFAPANKLSIVAEDKIVPLSQDANNLRKHQKDKLNQQENFYGKGFAFSTCALFWWNTIKSCEIFWNSQHSVETCTVVKSVMFTFWTSRSVLSIRPSPFKYIQIKQANTSTFCPSYITLGNLHRAKIRAPGHIFFDRGYRDTGIPSLEIFVPWMSSPYCPHDVDRTVDVMGSKPKPSKVSKENKHDDIKSFDFLQLSNPLILMASWQMLAFENTPASCGRFQVMLQLQYIQCCPYTSATLIRSNIDSLKQVDVV